MYRVERRIQLNSSIVKTILNWPSAYKEVQYYEGSNQSYIVQERLGKSFYNNDKNSAIYFHNSQMMNMFNSNDEFQKFIQYQSSDSMWFQISLSNRSTQVYKG